MLQMTMVALLLGSLVVGAVPLPRTDDAVSALREDRWDDALPLLKSVVAANPFEGRARYYLAVTYQELERDGEAVDEFRAALDLGVNGTRSGMRAAHVALARGLAATGDVEGALVHLEEAWARWGFDGLVEILRDDDFAPLHEDPRLRDLAGLDKQADAGDREARWRADIRYLRRLLAVAHPEPFHSADASRWNAAADRLVRDVVRLSDREIVAALMRLLASIGDGHTAIYPPTEGELAWHLLPFFPVRLEDGWYVAAAPPEYAHLVGAKLLKAAGRDWQEMVDFTAGHLASDNAFTARWLAAVGLQFAELYALVSGRTDSKQVELVAELADGTRVSADLIAQPITRNPNAHWAPEGWTTPYQKAPLWLRDPTRLFHHELLPETGVVYARILRMADGEEQSLAEYGRALREFFTGNDARALILDLRLNNGGDANEARDLIDELIRIPGLEKPGSLAVLTGPRTFSATGYLLGMMEKHLAPVFVGWPSGCRPVGYSSERSFRLPYSGLSGSISYELRVDGNSTDDVRPSFFPHHRVWPSGEDLRQSRDPVLATALQALR